MPFWDAVCETFSDICKMVCLVAVQPEPVIAVFGVTLTEILLSAAQADALTFSS